MAHTLGALKRARQNEKRRQANHQMKSVARTDMKKVKAAVAKKDHAAAIKALAAAYQSLDKAAGRGAFHANFAARHKSRLAAEVATLAPKKN